MKLSPTKHRGIGRSGAAVLEFALIAPLFVTLLLSVCDLAPSLMVKFKVGTATQAVADLAAQSATVGTSDIPNLFSIGSDVMIPFAGTPLVQRVSNIASDGTKAFVYWSCAESPLVPLTVLATVTPPSGLISTTSSGTDTSYVVVESQYTYTAPAGFILKTAQIMTNTSYTLPRISTYIGPTTGVAGYVPPKPSAIKSYVQTVTNGVTCNSGY